MKKYPQFLFIILLVAFWTFSTSVYAIEPESSTEYQGIDISRYQEEVDFEAVANAGVEVVYIKSSEGIDYVDPYFETNYEGAIAAGLDVGFYHFVIARTVDEAIEEAKFFVSTISEKEYTAKPVMDFEDFGNLSVEEINSIALAFAEEVEKQTGQQVMVYSNANNATNVFNESLTKYSLWIAQYDANEPSDEVIWDTWAGWQYTDMGRVEGVNGNVDENTFNDGIFLEDATVEETEPVTTPTSASANKGSYTIKQGDTLTAIARMHEVTVSALVKENQIANADRIYPGQILEIPSNSNSDQNKSTTNYIVKSGDTLYAIAKKHNTTVSKIITDNSIENPDLIYPGDTILISK